MYSTYVIYELLIRLQALDPAVGDYVSFKKIKAGICVMTTTGPLEIPDILLDLQFNNPAKINNEDLLKVLRSLP
ncbi:hypothetical protein [Pedobacter sp. JCM 36344]|uniref:hypothetical protein n=1 Tax=Pedobacter sp. JCM 36344 TaxID=3374280 RepID=UPI00397D2D3C